MSARGRGGRSRGCPPGVTGPCRPQGAEAASAAAAGRAPLPDPRLHRGAAEEIRLLRLRLRVPGRDPGAGRAGAQRGPILPPARYPRLCQSSGYRSRDIIPGVVLSRARILAPCGVVPGALRAPQPRRGARQPEGRGGATVTPGHGPSTRPLLPCGRSCPRCAPVQLRGPDPAPLPRCFPPGSHRTHPGAGAQPWPWLLAGTSGGAPACPPPATAGARDKGAPGDFEHTQQFEKPSFPPGAAVGFGDFYFSLFKGKVFCISAPPGPNQLRPRAGWGRGSSGPWWSGDLLQGPWTRGGSGALVRVPK